MCWWFPKRMNASTCKWAWNGSSSLHNVVLKSGDSTSKKTKILKSVAFMGPLKRRTFEFPWRLAGDDFRNRLEHSVTRGLAHNSNSCLHRWFPRGRSRNFHEIIKKFVLRWGRGGGSAGAQRVNEQPGVTIAVCISSQSAFHGSKSGSRGWVATPSL